MLAGCTVNQDLMFRTDRDFVFDEWSKAKDEAYTLAPNDRLQLQLYSNNGQRLMAMTAGSLEDGRANNLLQNQQVRRVRSLLHGCHE